MSPEELVDLVKAGRIRDGLRNLVKYDLIYALGFNLASYVSGRWADDVAPHLAHDSQLAKDFGAVLGFLSGASVIGFGAEVGITMVEEGGVGPKYGTAYAVDGKGGVALDGKGKPVPFAAGRSGGLSENWKFWPFSITHTYVSAMLSHLPAGELARCYMPAGAVAASVTSLHETLAPVFFGKVVPAWLDGERDGGDFMRKCVADLRQPFYQAVPNYALDVATSTFSIPRAVSYKGAMRAMFRVGCASLALSGRLVAALVQSKGAKLGLNIANNVVLGPAWSWLVRVPGVALADIQASGPAAAAVAPGAAAPAAVTAAAVVPAAAARAPDAKATTRTQTPAGTRPAGWNPPGALDSDPDDSDDLESGGS